MHVYLTDFGLTKRTSAAARLTKTGHCSSARSTTSRPSSSRAARRRARGRLRARLRALRDAGRRSRRSGARTSARRCTRTCSDPPPRAVDGGPGVPPRSTACWRARWRRSPTSATRRPGDFARAAQAAVEGQAPSEPERTVAIGRAAPGQPAARSTTRRRPPPSRSRTRSTDTGSTRRRRRPRRRRPLPRPTRPRCCRSAAARGSPSRSCSPRWSSPAGRWAPCCSPGATTRQARRRAPLPHSASEPDDPPRTRARPCRTGVAARSRRCSTCRSRAAR